MSEILKPFLSSTIHIGEMPSGSLLLHGNAHYPWFIIVPGGEFVEWIDLPMETQQKLLTDLNSLSQFLRGDAVLKVGKINVAAIGNMVPQFHLHIVGRHPEDPAWPGPVWGHSDHRDYAEGEVEGILARLKNSVSDFQHV